MAQILVRGLDDETVRRLKARAQRHGRSLQAEARELARQSQQKLAGRQFPNSTDLVREDRQR